MHNIIKAYKSTVLGIIFIAAGIYTGVTAKATWGESTIIIAAGCALLKMNDNVFKKHE